MNISNEYFNYSVKYIRDPDRCTNRNVAQHRLMGLAWLPNTDFINKPIINHINGVKKDNSLINLEWCSYVENAQHALKTGLTNQSLMVKTRDAATGEIEIHDSYAELCRKFGLSRGYSSHTFDMKLPGALFKNRYEIKRFNDTTPWYYENRDYVS